MQNFVLDCSITITWIAEDQSTPLSISALEALSKNSAYVPSIWFLEVTNSVLKLERMKRITKDKAETFLNNLKTFPIVVTPQTQNEYFDDILRLARENGLSTYDAAYLFLAQKENLPLITLESALSKAAAKLNLPKWKIKN